jgi:hypothetical protein
VVFTQRRIAVIGHMGMCAGAWLVSASGDAAVTEARDDYAAPRFSPDGRTLYARMTPTNEHVQQQPARRLVLAARRVGHRSRGDRRPRS